jgi:hypothetical protein
VICCSRLFRRRRATFFARYSGLCVPCSRPGAVLLERARAAGEVRPGSSVTEVLRLVYGIGLANDHAGDLDDAEKMFDIVITGIAT